MANLAFPLSRPGEDDSHLEELAMAAGEGGGEEAEPLTLNDLRTQLQSNGKIVTAVATPEEERERQQQLDGATSTSV